MFKIFDCAKNYISSSDKETRYLKFTVSAEICAFRQHEEYQRMFMKVIEIK